MIAQILIALIALQHTYFMILEMFLWDRPHGRKVFGNTLEFALASRTLAANQGLYNGFLVAGLVWSLIAPLSFATSLRLFFLGCVLVAGLFGGATVSRRILFLQAGPAAVGLAFVLLGL